MDGSRGGSDDWWLEGDGTGSSGGVEEVKVFRGPPIKSSGIL
jgi:hypothetical protein